MCSYLVTTLDIGMKLGQNVFHRLGNDFIFRKTSADICKN